MVFHEFVELPPAACIRTIITYMISNSWDSSPIDVPPPILPTELVLHIISLLDVHRDKPTIAICSLIASAYRVSAQKRLFYSAHFDLYFKKRGPYVLTRDPSPRSTKFLRALTACPSLEKYVRYVKTTFNYLPDDDESDDTKYNLEVPWFNILSKLQHLETLILNTPAGLAWIRLDELTRKTIESALHCNPNLQILSLNGMKTVPPSILSHSRHLDGLLVSTIGRMEDFDAEHNAGRGSPTDPRSRALLNSLSMGWCARGSEFQTTIKFFASADCPFSLSSLTSLVLTTSNALPEDLQFIISLCSKSISELTFLAPDKAQYSGTTKPSPSQISEICPIVDLSLLKLSRLRISSRVIPQPNAEFGNSAGTTHTALPWIGEVIKTIPIEHLSILPCSLELKISYDDVRSTKEPLHWSTISVPVYSRWQDPSLLMVRIKTSDRKVSVDECRQYMERLKKDLELLSSFGQSLVWDDR